MPAFFRALAVFELSASLADLPCTPYRRMLVLRCLLDLIIVAGGKQIYLCFWQCLDGWRPLFARSQVRDVATVHSGITWHDQGCTHLDYWPLHSVCPRTVRPVKHEENNEVVLAYA